MNGLDGLIGVNTEEAGDSTSGTSGEKSAEEWLKSVELEEGVADSGEYRLSDLVGRRSM